MWFSTTWTNQLFSLFCWHPMIHGNISLSISFSLYLFFVFCFLHVDSLCFPNTCLPTCQNFPLRGIQLWSSCLYGFYTGNSFLKTDYGNFWISLSFFMGPKTSFNGVDAVRRTNYCPPTACGRVHMTLPASTPRLKKKSECTGECHWLLVSWLAPLCQTVLSFF